MEKVNYLRRRKMNRHDGIGFYFLGVLVGLIIILIRAKYL